jgi:5-methylcytosine-specific restriction endonuclease McrA
MLFNTAKAQSAFRGHEFDLTELDYVVLVTKPCWYCGGLPVNREGTKSLKRVNGAPKYNGVIAHHGIDRKNSDVGYILANCVPCCKQCNYAKGVRSDTDFVAWVRKVFRHTENWKLSTNWTLAGKLD